MNNQDSATSSDNKEIIKSLKTIENILADIAKSFHELLKNTKS